MTRDEIIDLQTKLHNRGYGPVQIDGIYGPQTAAAYAEMLKFNPVGGLDQSLPVPAPAKPWWISRAIIGSVVTVALSVLGAFVDWKLDAESLTDVIYQIVVAIAGLLAFIGTVKRQAPIDPTLVVPGVRLPAGRVSDQRLPTDRTAQSKSPFLD
jgi:uncharacterized membrane protein